MITIKITRGDSLVETYTLDGSVMTSATGGRSDFGDITVAKGMLLDALALDVSCVVAEEALAAERARNTTVPLGKTQQGMLRSLRDHGYYRHGGGWIWDNRSTTEKVLDSLVRRGLVAVTMETVDPLIRKPYEARTWRLTEAGTAAIVEWTPRSAAS